MVKRVCCGSTAVAYIAVGVGLLCLTPWVLLLLVLAVALSLCCHILGYLPAFVMVSSRQGRLLLLHTGRPVHYLRQGLILAASGQISEGVFAGSRVLIVKYSPYEGAIGVILNRTFIDPSSMQLLHCGGPISQEIPRVIHSVPSIAESHQVLPGVFVGGEIQEIVEQEPAHLFVFYGYCMWRAKQLDGEVRSGLWRVEGVVQPTQIFAHSY